MPYLFHFELHTLQTTSRGKRCRGSVGVQRWCIGCAKHIICIRRNRRFCRTGGKVRTADTRYRWRQKGWIVIVVVFVVAKQATTMKALIRESLARTGIGCVGVISGYIYNSMNTDDRVNVS